MYVMTLHRSSIGKKIIMAVTGLIWVGFVLLHMYGNLKVFLGPEYFNAYAEGLRTLGAPIFGHTHLLYVARLVLTVALVLHVWSAYSLTQQAHHARPSNYIVRQKVQANRASLSMRWGGVVILIFLIYHLMHLTWGLPVAPGVFVQADAYHNLVNGFHFIPATILYLLGVTALSFHLYHGVFSAFQTLGLNNQNTETSIKGAALALSLVISIGFAVVPLSVVAGIVR
jgi:succinate dehydrogenase / fumarate reductase cytochrome b subunit